LVEDFQVKAIMRAQPTPSASQSQANSSIVQEDTEDYC